MRAAPIFVALFLFSCGGGSPDVDGGIPDGSADDGSLARRDANCGPVASTRSECVMDSCSGGLTCVNGPCPYPCCLGGRLETCELIDGVACDMRAPMDCGAGTCVSAGNPCP